MALCVCEMLRGPYEAVVRVQRERLWVALEVHMVDYEGLWGRD